MSIIDLFLGNSSGRSLYKDKLEKLLKEISALSPEEREYVKAMFSKYVDNGISKTEAIEAIRSLRFNTSDSLDSTEVEKIRLKILSFFV